ncbi:MAG: FAD:protein FMN transferase [Puniceicoccaceae bacterium]|nr:MAG: FAD:protein FMN transferase [Puniceicoccaceae bacterium]|tara:strand:- start:385 stop:1194 length:810 start_codon:yes stop_codon:yes gene_type:complete
MDRNSAMINAHTYTHEAMKTTFTLRLIHAQADHARDAANQAFALIDEIENALSRYISGSDVSQINSMQSGQSLFISETCYECMRIALKIYIDTDGLFDITLGRQIEHEKNKLKGIAPELIGQLMVDPDRPAIHCVEAGREIDLGGIGKGYALDRIAPLLLDLGIKGGLASAGTSTQLAFGESTWKIELTGSRDMPIVELKNQALSVSGTEIQGSHIVSPRRTKFTHYAHARVRVIHEEAACADAWSTACLLMTESELEAAKDRITVYCG